MRKLLIPLAAALLAAPFSLLSNASMAATPIPFTTISAGFNSSYSMTAADVVVRTQDHWNRVWQKHAPGTALPAVDFTQNDVYCVFLGWTFSSGFSIDITNVSADASKVVVNVTNTAPGPDCNVLGIVTSPFQIVSVPKQPPVHVRFLHTLALTLCP